MRDRISAIIWLLFKAAQTLGSCDFSNSEIAASASCIVIIFNKETLYPPLPLSLPPLSLESFELRFGMSF
jgi:hypothetical protein